MCVYMCVCAYICMCVCAFICACAYICMCVFLPLLSGMQNASFLRSIVLPSVVCLAVSYLSHIP